MRWIIAICPLVLAACAQNVDKTANITGNAVSVTVNNVWNANQAFPLADRHCHQYGKAARLSGSREYAFTFDCLVP
ncbi:MAG: hypothetical protein V4579_11255 [Pseudomonadota bacterium]